MRTRSGRRSGISSVIGAIFFVLVVFLVFTSTIVVFEAFTGYANSFRHVNQQDVQNKQTSIGISDLVFGGTTTPSVNETLTPTLQNSVSAESLLPVANMNLTNNMKGWTFARDYKIVRDNASISNSFLNVLPGYVGFTLNVTNDDASGNCPLATSCINKVSMLIDPRFASVCSPSPCTAPAGWNTPVVSGNTITWTAFAGSGISAGAPTVSFDWLAIAPAVPNDYFHTVTLTWLTTFKGVPLVDSGSATVMTTVVTSGPGGVSIPAVCSVPAALGFNICSEKAGVIPGGAFGGYDPLSNQIGSQSGPGSLYLDFQPTFNGTAITGTAQLTAVMNYTTAFYLDSSTASALLTGAGSDALNYGYSLDRVLSPPNPVVGIQTFLVQLQPSGAINNIVQISDQVPTQLGGVNVNSSGWITCMSGSTDCPTPAFDPNALAAAQHGVGSAFPKTWTWGPGLYELVISVTAGMPGANPGGYYPPSLEMHFDDIGLSLREVPTSYYVDNSLSSQMGFNPSMVAAPKMPTPCGGINPTPCMLEIPSSVDPTQVQSIHLTAQLALTPTAGTNVTAYVFIGDVARGTLTPLWVEVGQVTFSSSVTLSAVIPASSSSIYIDQTGHICSNICVRIYAIANGASFTGLAATVSVVVQTWKQSSIVVSVLNNSTFPVQLGSVYIAGPEGVESFNLHNANNPDVTGCPLNVACYEWVNGGGLEQIPLTVTWTTGQEYVVTLTTVKGVVVSQSFLSP